MIKYCFIFILLSLLTLYVSFAQQPHSLNGDWLFMPDSTHKGLKEHWYEPAYDRSQWRTITVPSFWESVSGLENYDGWGWYARTFTVEKRGKLNIAFDGVDDNGVVWLNGTMIGSHTGYNQSFTLRATGAVKEGENAIIIQVIDNGKGGGIYKPVALTQEDKPTNSKKPAYRSADWVKDAVIYCAYLRSASPEGTFAGLEKRIIELKAIGVNVLWLMPIHPVGLKNRKGTLGSPYAVRDYYDVNPEFGTILDFQKLLTAAHNNGIKVIIDLVANHTAWDSKLIEQHPEWFTRNSSGAIVSPNADWTDVADFDYSKPGLRKYMIGMMEWWVQDIGIDGFRCDVSELVPLDFWIEARKRLNNIKPVMMLSEGSLPEHHLKAFDITYSWNLYDLLDPLLKGTSPASSINDLLQGEASQFPNGSLRLRFNTNHDKNAWESPAILKYGYDGLALTAVLCSTLPGIPLLYTGEEVANDKKLSLFEKNAVDWSRPREMESLYTTLFHLRSHHKSLSRGDLVWVPTSHDDAVYAFFRTFGDDKILTVLNFSPDSISVQLQLPINKIYGKRIRTTLQNILSETQTTIERGRYMEVMIPPRGYQIYMVPK